MCIQSDLIGLRLSPQAMTSGQQRALCRLAAITRGFLTRRLLQTEKVKHLRQTVQVTKLTHTDTCVCVPKVYVVYPCVWNSRNVLVDFRIHQLHDFSLTVVCVCTCMSMCVSLQDTQEFIRSFQTEAPQKQGPITPQDLSLQERVRAQVPNTRTHSHTRTNGPNNKSLRRVMGLLVCVCPSTLSAARGSVRCPRHLL